MFGKLQEAQQKAEEIKQKLEAITVEGESAQGRVKVIATGNKKIKDILIADELLSVERKAELQHFIVAAVENAMQAADNVSQSEMQALMSAMMPGGLGKLFGK